MLNKFSLTAILVSYFFSFLTAAQSPYSGFPDEFQEQLNSGNFVIAHADYLGLGFDNFSPWVGAYFEYTDLTQDPAEERVIIRYNIGGNSVFSTEFGGNPADTVAMTGILHLDGSRNYDEPSFGFKLFLEDMDQDIFDFIFFNESIRLFYQTSEALLAGEGSYIECADYYDCLDVENDLASPDQPLSCLGFVCKAGATFRLSRVGYVPSGSGFEIDIDPDAIGQTEFPAVFEQMQSAEDDPYSKKYDESQLWFQRFELGSVLPGDVNRDGVVDLSDVDRFVELLVSEDYRFEADMNQDLRFDLRDVSPFVSLLLNL